MTNIELRAVAERCSDGDSYYQLLGMPGQYQSPQAAKDMYDRVRQLKFNGVTTESFAAMLKFVGEKEAKKTASK